MKNFINKAENFNKVEFWAATTIFVFAIFFLVTNPVRYNYNWAPNKQIFDTAGISYNYYTNFFIPSIIQYTTLYLSFLLLNFYVVPKIIKREELAKNIVLITLTTAALGIIFGITDTYLKNYLFIQYGENTYNRIFQNAFLYAFWLVLIFGFYSIIKYTGIYLLSHSEEIQAKYRYITRGIITVFILWMISIFLLTAGDVDGDLVLFWIIFSITGIIFYFYSVNSLIPASLTKKKPLKSFLGRSTLIIIPLTVLLLIFLGLVTNDEEATFTIGLFTGTFHLFITTPAIWVIYKRQMLGDAKIYHLEKELGHSTASFDFLRSQINPHFLFNALNTIYGTAIQEKAERTGEGIEKLGDMMRFMLQENMQEKISLAREIEYLNNYIGLQKLRTDANPNVKINTEIEEPVDNYQISPMLLIPFVENAFKHGISFREPSHINITLETKENTLYFDVYNSKHSKQEQDPEKHKSGIGLNNVKQRLQLLYNDQYELILRETGKEYFIHLTMKLS